MEGLAHDDQSLLVAPYEYALYYVYQHFPESSFIFSTFKKKEKNYDKQ